jgi:hypothetical protein
MSRYIKHVILWLLVVPWLASTLWFWLDGLLRSREFHPGMILGVLPFAFAYGAIGTLLCLVVTLPLCLACAIIFTRSPDWLRIPRFRKGFVAFAAVIGLGTSAFANKLLNTGRVEHLLLIIGLAGGVVLAVLTLRLWNSGRTESSRSGV